MSLFIIDLFKKLLQGSCLLCVPTRQPWRGDSIFLAITNLLVKGCSARVQDLGFVQVCEDGWLAICVHHQRRLLACGCVGGSGHSVCQVPRAAPQRHQLPPVGQGMLPASAALHCFLECFLTSLLGLRRETRSFPRPFPDDRSAAKPFLFQRGRAGVCLPQLPSRHCRVCACPSFCCWSFTVLLVSVRFSHPHSFNLPKALMAMALPACAALRG